MNVPLRDIRNESRVQDVTEQTEVQEFKYYYYYYYWGILLHLFQIRVKPFIEVSFGSERQRTSTRNGPHPHWNEEIVLPLMLVQSVHYKKVLIIMFLHAH